MSYKKQAADVVQEKDSSLYLVQKTVSTAMDVLPDVVKILSLKK